MSATPTPSPMFTVTDQATGLPIPGALVYTYEAGTSTLADTWADADKLATNLNPVEMDANGQARIYIDGLYKFIVHDADDNLLYSIDDIIGGTTAFDRPASGVSSLPFDDIAATNVQDALEEIGLKRVKATAVIDIAHGGTGAITAAAARTALGLVIGTDVQAYSALLALMVAAGLDDMFSGFVYAKISNNVTDATNDIDVAAGATALNTTGVDFLHLSSGITKRLDAAWAVGSGNGGRDTGSIANGIWAVHLIKRPDTGVVDVLFSLSATAPTLPTNYTLFRRIGWIIRSGAVILPFTQNGNDFTLATAVEDLNAAGATGPTLVTLTVPPSTTAKFRGIFDVPATDVFMRAVFTEAGETAIAASATNASLQGRGDGTRSWDAAGNFALLVSSASQISWSTTASSGGSSGAQLIIQTFGWTDSRGRNAP